MSLHMQPRQKYNGIPKKLVVEDAIRHGHVQERTGSHARDVLHHTSHFALRQKQYIFISLSIYIQHCKLRSRILASKVLILSRYIYVKTSKHLTRSASVVYIV